MRRTLPQAILGLYLEAKPCECCGTLYVGGRRGNVFCSERCARRIAQRRYRARLSASVVGG